MSKDIEQQLKAMGLSLTYEFVPFSQSRSKDQKIPNLNWIVSLWKDQTEVIKTDYSAGQAYCPSYPHRASVDGDKATKDECEQGYTKKNAFTKKPIEPKLSDVVYSLVMDSDVLQHESFEDWADCYGYNSDSKKDEKVYKACLKIALPMQLRLGSETMETLRELFGDY